MNESKSPPIALIALALLVLLAAGYIGMYALNVYRRPYFTASQTNVGYRVGGEWSELAFAPIHKLDRRVRKEYWAPSDFDGLIDLIITTVEPTTSDDAALAIKRD